MTETGEEITLLPYDNDIGDKDGGEKAKETEVDGDTGNTEKSVENTDQIKSDVEGHLLPDDQTQEGGNSITPPANESKEAEGEFDNGHGEHEEKHEYDIPPPTDQEPEPTEPEEPRQPERSTTPPILPHPESNFPQPNVDQSSFPSPTTVHPYQPQPHSESPEPHHPQSTPTSVGPEVCQVIATGMNTEMQQYASLLASQALTQFPNQMMAIARHIMLNFEQRYGPPWCCIVSNGQLGFYLRYDRENHIYFALSRHTIFLYKASTS